VLDRTNYSGLSVFGIRRVVCAVLVVAFMAIPAHARAEGEVTGVIGGMLGGDLNNVLAGNINVKGAFDNGPIYGARLGWAAGLIGVEGSFLYSPSGVAVTFPNQSLSLNGDVSFLEGNFLFIPIPGPFSPFVTAGAGMHSYKLDLDVPSLSLQVADVQKLGFNFGGGIKIKIKSLILRGEVRDHMTSISPGDLDLENIAPDLFDEQWLHNVEISAGIGIRF
jgi:opacity protein-like surface antigen